ncbi:MAG: alpha/beta hydrolase [Comamonas sp.]|jgi:predicted alpha/beta hydrolase family esterase|uniref:RBBP9/YdeN family alpha/beta hydrolase n=1 Tax=Comamonas sp. TaxID=34028 RepID=UPI0028228ADC|nr:alpha/beta hydrolase [Comamonas sp.]MDR0215203.1 alpha/beta hydrolase [Comamonas sp.]
MTNPNYPADITFLIVPGLRDHVHEHWQTHLAGQLAKAVTVPPLEHDKLSRAARVEALNSTLASIEGSAVIVAHSAGCITTVHWAQQHAQQAGRIKAALLATPADVENAMPEGYPTVQQLQSNGWVPIPRQSLPFKTLVAASRNDPLAQFARIEGLAADWGASLLDLGEVGHLNPAGGYGPWGGVHQLLQQLV